MDGGAWWATVHQVIKSQTRLSNTLAEVEQLLCIYQLAVYLPVHCKGNQSWIFTGRADAEAEAPIFWPPDVKS